MEQLGISALIEFLKVFGFAGMVFLIWFYDRKQFDRMLAAYKDDMAAKDADYKAQITAKDESYQTHQAKMWLLHDQTISEIRTMYANNVELVRRYVELSSDLKDVIMLNTRTITQLCDNINGNQYCPMIRLKKEAQGVQE